MNDLEIAVAWPWTREPTLTVTGRVFGSDVIDVGLRGSVTPPLIRNGDTVVRGGIPVVIRAHRLLRIQTGLDIDLLLTPQISPWASIPLQLLGIVTDRVFMGLQGAVGWLVGGVWTAQVGTFVGHTVSATDGHPVFEVRWSGTYIIDTPAFHIGAALTIYPRLW